MLKTVSPRSGQVRSALVLGVLGVSTAALFGWLWSDSSEELAPPNRSALQEHAAGPPDRTAPTPQPNPTGAKARASLEAEAQRVTPTPSEPFLRGRLLDTANAPIENATLVWTGWSSADFAGAHAARLLASSEALERWTVRTTSAADGTFAFFESPPFELEPGPDEALTSVLWALSIGHIAAGTSLTGTHQGKLPDTILDSGGPIEVRVLDGKRPALGATLELRAARYPEPLEWDQPHPAWLLNLKATVQEQGLLRLPRFPFEVHLEASLGARSSQPYVGPAESPVTLQLASTCTIEGSAELDAWNPDLGAPRVVILAARADKNTPIASACLNADLTFGPLLVPVLEADEYIARLEGGGFVPSEIAFAAPTEGQTIQLALEAQPGAMTWLAGFTKLGGEYLRDAVATVTWASDGGKLSASFHANPDGYILVSGLPAGVVFAILTAPGYTESQVTPFRVPEVPEPTLHEAQLFPERRLQGVCLAAGQPVTDFELFYWWSVDQEMFATLAIQDAEHGNFEINNAFPGEMGIFASAPGLGASPRITIHAGESQVQLELAPYRSVTGRVVDPTGLPIPEARAHLVTLNKEYPMQPFGAEVQVDPAGRFTLSQLPPQPVQVVVEAPAFSASTTRVADLQSPSIDLGEVQLVPRQTLTIHADTLAGARAFAATMDGTTIPRTPLDASGELVVPDMNAGPCMLYVADDSRLWTQWRTVTLDPGADWRLDFAFTGGESVRIQAVPRASAQLPAERIWVSSARQGLHGERIQDTFFLDEDGGFTLQGLGPGQALFELKVHATGEAGMGSLQIEQGGGPFALTIPIGAEDWRVHVVDSLGAPIEGARVYLYGLSPAAPFASRFTDPMGDAAFAVLGPAYTLAAVRTSEGGLLLDLPFTPPKDKQTPVNLVAELSAHVRVVLLEDGAPQADLTVSYDSKALGFTEQGLSARSNSTGEAELGPLSAGAKQFLIQGPGLWRMSATIEGTASGPATPIEVYHLGSLELRFIHADGTPAAGLSVELIHTKLAQSVAAWIQAGRTIASSSPALVTDGTGRLTLGSIPRGTYSWHAAGITGSIQTSSPSTTLLVP